MSDSDSLTDDQLMLYTIGLNIHQSVVSLFVEASCWGIYALLFAFSVYIQCSNGLKSIRNRIMLGVTCVLFLTSTTLLSLNLSWLLRNKIQKILMIKPEEPLLDKYMESTAEIPRFGTASEALFLLNMLIGDAVVIWRAHVIWDRRNIIILIPIVSLLAALGFAITDVVCLSASSGTFTSTVPVGSRVCAWAEPISWGLSLLTNVVSTSLIAVKAWLFRRDIKKLLGHAPPKTMAQRVLILLVESGFIYCLFWIGEVVLFLDIDSYSPAAYVWQFFAAIGDQISGIYPTAIICLVSMQKTYVESTVHYPSPSPQSGRRPAESTTLTQIAFASSGRTASTDTRTVDFTSTGIVNKEDETNLNSQKVSQSKEQV